MQRSRGIHKWCNKANVKVDKMRKISLKSYKNKGAMENKSRNKCKLSTSSKL